MPGKPNDKWLATMIAKHGSREAVTAIMQANGRKGGKTNHGAPKGFAQDRELASAAGKKGGLVRGEQYKRSKLGAEWNNQNSKTSSYSTKLHRDVELENKPYRSKRAKGTCSSCLRDRVIFAHGTCQTCWRNFNKLTRDLIKETEAINRGEISNNYEAVVVPGWGHTDDKPEFIIDRPLSLYERFFGWRHHR